MFTGFGNRFRKLNVQALFNASTGASTIASTEPPPAMAARIDYFVDRTNVPPLELRGRDFSFDPRTLDLRAESGGGPYGLSFDNRGRKFVCSNCQPHSAPSCMKSVTPLAIRFRRCRALWWTSRSMAAQAPVYRISPDEPWRVIRTNGASRLGARAG